MKRFLLLTFATTLLFGIPGAHAAKCKFAEDSVDPFTKVKTRTTKFDQLTSSWMEMQRELDASIAVNSVDGELQLWVQLDYTRRTELGPSDYELLDTVVVLEGAPLLIMMADEAIVTLHAIEGVTQNAHSIAPEEHSFETSEFTVAAIATIRYLLDPDTAAALSAQNATNIRITAEDRNFDIEIHKKSIEDFQNAIRCIQS